MPNTKEKLIDLLDEVQECGQDFDDYELYGVRYPCTVRNEYIADHLIDNGVTVQKWIPVAERLPDKNGEYLCRWVNKSVSDAEYESTYGSFGYWFNFWEDEYKDWISYEGITHWMPLPDPPKGE